MNAIQLSSARNLLKNPLFEDTEHGQPAGWVFDGPEDERNGAFSDEQCHTGSRSLRFRGVAGDQSWTSDPVAVSWGKPYYLSWWTYISGREPWHWSYHTRFCGVRVSFHDATGSRTGVVEKRIRSIGTEDWVCPWITCDAPPDARTCTVSFICESDIDTDGVFFLDDVFLTLQSELTVPAGDAGLLRCRVLDDETGNPAPARITVVGANGQRCHPATSTPLLDGRFHTLDGFFEMLLPVGAATVTVMRGFQHEVWSDIIDVRKGDVTEVESTPKRKIDLAANGWYGGDCHIHLFFHRHTLHPQMTPSTVMRIAEAEGLDFLSFKGEIIEAQHCVENGIRWKTDRFIGEIGVEAVSDFHGHAYCVNLTAMPETGFPMRLVPWPMNCELYKSLLKQDAALICAHPHSRYPAENTLEAVADPAITNSGREWPVDVALGLPVAFDILCNEGVGGVEPKIRDYYRMLNTGMKCGLSASTDAYVDQGVTVPGACRTYLHAGELSWRNVAAAYRRGATFVTNGPLVNMSLNNTGPGDTVCLQSEEPAKVSLRAYSSWGLTRAEVIWNGEVVHTEKSSQNGLLGCDISIPVKESGWCAVRVFGPSSEHVDSKNLPESWQPEIGQFAHTSPIYVEIDDRPMQSDEEAVRYFIGWVDGYRNAVLKREDLLQNDNGTWDESVREQILERLEEARAVYCSLLATE